VCSRGAWQRTYTAKYKRDVLAEYEAADRAGKGALLRREGLYSSLISAWREQRAASTVAALGRSCGPAPTNPAQRDPVRLRRESSQPCWTPSGPTAAPPASDHRRRDRRAGSWWRGSRPPAGRSGG